MGSQQIFLLGRVASEIEMRYTPAGVPVSSFSFAVNEYYTDKDGQRQERTSWYRVSCWQKLAEVVNQYLGKGREAYITGNRIEARAFTDKNGELRASLEVTAREVQFIGSRDDVGAQATAQGEAPASEKNGGDEFTDDGNLVPF